MSQSNLRGIVLNLCMCVCVSVCYEKHITCIVNTLRNSPVWHPLRLLEGITALHVLCSVYVCQIHCFLLKIPHWPYCWYITDTNLFFQNLLHCIYYISQNQSFTCMLLNNYNLKIWVVWDKNIFCVISIIYILDQFFTGHCDHVSYLRVPGLISWSGCQDQEFYLVFHWIYWHYFHCFL